MMKTIFALVGFLALAESEGTGLRAAVRQQIGTGCSYGFDNPSNLETTQLCVTNSGAFAVNSYQLWDASNGGCALYTFSGGCLDLTTLASGGCYLEGHTLQMIVNADAAFCAYDVNYNFVITRYATNYNIVLNGGVDNIWTSMSQSEAAQPANANALGLPCCSSGASNCNGGSCTAANAACVSCNSNGYWQFVSSGDQYTLTSSITWSSSTSTTDSTTTTNTIAASLGVNFDSVSASLSYTHSLAETASSTYTNTNGGSTTTSETITCNDGSIYQWIVTSTQTYPGVNDQTTTIASSNFVCVPATPGGTPKCPPGYCGNLEENTVNGIAGGCQCCGSLEWAADPSTVQDLLCPPPTASPTLSPTPSPTLLPTSAPTPESLVQKIKSKVDGLF